MSASSPRIGFFQKTDNLIERRVFKRVTNQSNQFERLNGILEQWLRESVSIQHVKVVMITANMCFTLAQKRAWQHESQNFPWENVEIFKIKQSVEISRHTVVIFILNKRSKSQLCLIRVDLIVCKFPSSISRLTKQQHGGANNKSICTYKSVNWCGFELWLTNSSSNVDRGNTKTFAQPMTLKDERQVEEAKLAFFVIRNGNPLKAQRTLKMSHNSTWFRRKLRRHNNKEK
jgi:hypothetical protein